MNDDALPAARTAPTGLAAVGGRLLRSDSFLHQVMLLGSGTALSQVILFLSTILLARLYLPDALGNWAVFISTAATLLPLVNLRYELAILLPSEEAESSNVLWLATAIACITSLLITLAAWGSGEYWLNDSEHSELGTYLWLLGPQLLLMGLVQSGTYWMTRHQRFRLLALSATAGAAVTVTVQVVLWFFRASFLELILGSMAGQLVVALLLWQSVYRRDWPHVRGELSRSQLRPLARRYSNFPLYSVPYGMVGGISTTVLIWMIGIFGSGVERGLYSLAFRITYAPISLIGGALRQVFFRRAASEVAPQTLEPFVLRTLTGIILFTTPPAVYFMLNAESIFMLIFGANWSGSGAYAFWLTLPALVQFLTAWLDRLYDVLRQNRLALLLELIHSVVNISGVYLSFRLGADPVSCVKVFSLIAAGYNLLWLAITFRVAGFSSRSLLVIFAWLIGAVAVSVLLYGMLVWQLGSVAGMVVYGVATCGLYAAAAYHLLLRK